MGLRRLSRERRTGRIRRKWNIPSPHAPLESPRRGKGMTQPLLIIADDHPLFRAALREVVGRYIPGAHIIEVSALDALQAAIANHPDSDMVLLDLRMPGARGFSSLLYLRAEYPAVPIIV